MSPPFWEQYALTFMLYQNVSSYEHLSLRMSSGDVLVPILFGLEVLFDIDMYAKSLTLVMFMY